MILLFEDWKFWFIYLFKKIKVSKPVGKQTAMEAPW